MALTARLRDCGSALLQRLELTLCRNPDCAAINAGVADGLASLSLREVHLGSVDVRDATLDSGSAQCCGHLPGGRQAG